MNDPAERLPSNYVEQLQRAWEAARPGTGNSDHDAAWERWAALSHRAFPALAAAYQRGRDEAVGPYIGVRLRDARWVDSQHYDHYHDHGETVTHEVGEWCPHQLIGQNWPCPPQHDETAESAILDAGADLTAEALGLNPDWKP